MSNSLFSTLFVLPALADIYNGVSDANYSGADYASVALGDGKRPDVQGKALVRLVVGAAFNGGRFEGLPAKSAGHKAAIIKALGAAGTLPACKGGKNARALTVDELRAFLGAFAVALGEKAERATPAPKLPDIAAFIEKHGKDSAHAFAVALLGATGGLIDQTKDKDKKAA